MADKTLAKVANLVPTSANETIFQDPKASKEKQQSASKVGASVQEGGEAEKEIIPKEFFWDQLVTYIATAIALLTLVDTTVQFFRSTGGLLCYIPEEFIQGETRDQAAYVNNFCQESLSTSEYYSVFILIQGIVIVAPHYLWSSIFSGQFDFFFDLVRQIDRLRDSKTGEYRTKNFEILKKLENEFPERKKLFGMFILYGMKLALQFVIIVVSLVVNIAIFPGTYFQFVFDCPAELADNGSSNSSQLYRGWNLPGQVQCIYSSFRILSKVQYADYLLLVLALGAVGYGLFWCFKRHTSGLGYREIATFAFTSCLSPAEFVFRRSFLLPPRVENDLDFLLMRLFRADPGHGRVFKDLQVDKELTRLVSEDHELLHLTSSIIQDRNEVEMKSSYTNQDPEEVGKYRMVDIKDFYTKAKFGENPDYLVYAKMGKLGLLGDMQVTQEHTHESLKSIRNQFFGFLRFTSEQYVVAYDISFGTIGFALILARAFKKVVSVNFHPFYRNEEEICRKEVFHAPYSRIIIPSDIFSKNTPSINKFEEDLDEEFLPPARIVGDLSIRPANLIVVGPFTDEAKKATVNLHIERLYTGEYFAKKACLLAIRPLRIAFKDTSSHFCQYKPPQTLFEAVVDADFKEKTKLTWETVGKYEGIRVTCGGTVCIFEFQLYNFVGVYQPGPPDHSHETPDNSVNSQGHPSTLAEPSTAQGNSNAVEGLNNSGTNQENAEAKLSNSKILINGVQDNSAVASLQRNTTTGLPSEHHGITLQQISSSSLQLGSQLFSDQSLQRPARDSHQTSVSVYSNTTTRDGHDTATSQDSLDSRSTNIPPLPDAQRHSADRSPAVLRPSSQAMLRGEGGHPHHLSLQSLPYTPHSEPLKRKTGYRFDLQPLTAQRRAGSKHSWQEKGNSYNHGLPNALSLPLVSNDSAPPLNEGSGAHVCNVPATGLAVPKATHNPMNTT